MVVIMLLSGFIFYELLKPTKLQEHVIINEDIVHGHAQKSNNVRVHA